jgi:hypothetical protein
MFKQYKLKIQTFGFLTFFSRGGVIFVADKKCKL